MACEGRLDRLPSDPLSLSLSFTHSKSTSCCRCRRAASAPATDKEQLTKARKGPRMFANAKEEICPSKKASRPNNRIAAAAGDCDCSQQTNSATYIDVVVNVVPRCENRPALLVAVPEFQIFFRHEHESAFCEVRTGEGGGLVNGGPRAGARGRALMSVRFARWR